MTDGAPMDVARDMGSDATDIATDIAPDIAPDVSADAEDVPVDSGPSMLTPQLFAQCGTVCSSPLDAVPNASGDTVFFTAFTPTGEGALFSATSGGTPTMVVGGFEYPIAVAMSPDNTTAFVADRTGTPAGGAGTALEGGGAVYRVNVGGGTRGEVTLGAMIVQIAALAVSADGTSLIISARDATGMPGVFTVPTSGGTARQIAVGGAFRDPSGIAAASDGTLYVHDLTAGGATSAAVVRVSASTSMTTLGMPRLVANYPAGLALSMDGTMGLLAGAPGDIGNGLLTTVDTGTMATNSAPSLSAGMVSPVGLHRALNANVFAVADDSAMNTGAIFVLR